MIGPVARWALGLVVALALAVVIAMPSRSAAEPLAALAIDLPVIVEGDGVIVRAERRLERHAHRIAERAPRTLARIAADLPGLPAPEPVEIRLVIWATDIGRASPPGARPPDWAAGVAYPESGIVVIAQRSGPEVNDIDSVVDHELAHLALGAALSGHAPRWLDEGFAYLHSSDFSLARTQTLIGLAWSGSVIPWHDIDRRFPHRESAAERAYAQSYDFVAFLARRGRYRDRDDDGDRWPFRDFLAALARGSDLSAASKHSYGVPFSDLGREWYADLRERFLTLPASLVGLAVWVLAALLLVIAYVRRKIQGRRKLADWEREEADLPSA